MKKTALILVLTLIMGCVNFGSAGVVFAAAKTEIASVEFGDTLASTDGIGLLDSLDAANTDISGYILGKFSNDSNCIDILDDSISTEAEGSSYEVEIEYYDDKEGYFVLWYDAINYGKQIAEDTADGKVVYKRGDGGLKTARFTIDNAAFNNSINGKGDLMISLNEKGIILQNKKSPLYVKSIRVFEIKNDVPVYVDASCNKLGNTFGYTEEKIINNEFTNPTDTAKSLSVKYELRDEAGTVHFSARESFSVNANSSTVRNISVNTDRCGVYNWYVTVTDDGNVRVFKEDTIAIMKTDPNGIRGNFGWMHEGVEKYTENEARNAINLMKKGNVAGLRLEVKWNDVEKGSKGNYSLAGTKFKQNMDLCEELGLPFYVLVYGGNTLYQESDSAVGMPKSATQREGWRGFCNYLFNALKDTNVLMYEIWNEPDLPSFNPTGATAEDLAEITRIARAELNKVNSATGNDVKLAGFSVTGLTDPYSGRLKNWITPGIEAGIAEDGLGMNVLSVHTYAPDREPEKAAIYDVIKQYQAEIGEISNETPQIDEIMDTFDTFAPSTPGSELPTGWVNVADVQGVTYSADTEIAGTHGFRMNWPNTVRALKTIAKDVNLDLTNVDKVELSSKIKIADGIAGKDNYKVFLALYDGTSDVAGFELQNGGTKDGLEVRAYTSDSPTWFGNGNLNTDKPAANFKFDQWNEIKLIWTKADGKAEYFVNGVSLGKKSQKPFNSTAQFTRIRLAFLGNSTSAYASYDDVKLVTYSSSGESISTEIPVLISEFGNSTLPEASHNKIEPDKIEALTTEEDKRNWITRAAILYKANGVGDYATAHTLGQKGIFTADREDQFGMTSPLYDKYNIEGAVGIPTESYLAYAAMNYILGGEITNYQTVFEGNVYANRFESAKFGKDILTLWAAYDNARASVDLGVDEITVFDMFGNERQMYSNSGIYTFDLDGSVTYVMGDFEFVDIRESNEGFEDTFDSYNSTSDLDYPAGWKKGNVINNNNTGASVVKSYNAGGEYGNVLQLGRTTTTASKEYNVMERSSQLGIYDTDRKVVLSADVYIVPGGKSGDSLQLEVFSDMYQTDPYYITPRFGLGIQNDNGSYKLMRWNDHSNYTNVIKTGTTPVTLNSGAWHNIKMEYDPTTKEVKYYVDNTLKYTGSDLTVNDSKPNAFGNIRIAAGTKNSTSNCQFYIDNVKFYVEEDANAIKFADMYGNTSNYPDDGCIPVGTKAIIVPSTSQTVEFTEQGGTAVDYNQDGNVLTLGKLLVNGNYTLKIDGLAYNLTADGNGRFAINNIAFKNGTDICESIPNAGTSIKAVVNAENSTATAQIGKVIIAEYGDNEVLLNAHIEDLDMYSGRWADSEYPFTVSVGCKQIKGFIWSDLEKFIPMINFTELN